MKPFNSLIHKIDPRRSKLSFDISHSIVLFLLGSYLFFNLVCFADGIPVSPDKKQVSGPYTRIELDAQQKIDVETKRQVSLRPDQKAILEKIAGGPLGYITVYNSRYNVCTCFDNSVMAIWTQNGFLDFPNNSIITLAKQKKLEKESSSGDETEPAPKIKNIIIVFDAKGDMYIKGRRIDNSKLLPWLDMLQGKNNQQSKRILIVFDPPPPISEDTDRKVLQQYRNVKTYCDKHGIETQDWGIE